MRMRQIWQYFRNPLHGVVTIGALVDLIIFFSDIIINIISCICVYDRITDSMESSKTPRGKCSNICAVRFCNTTSHAPGISLFRFPKDIARCNQWVKLCGCEYLEKSVKCLYSSMYRVCHLHFEKKMYSISVKTKAKRLIGNSMPTLDVRLMGFTSTLTTGIFNRDEVERMVEIFTPATTINNAATPLNTQRFDWHITPQTEATY